MPAEGERLAVVRYKQIKQQTTMTDKNVTPEESIQLIDQMIRATTERIERDAAIPFLIWGYLTVATSLAIYLLLPVMGWSAGWLWFAIPVLGWILMWGFGILSRQPKRVRTHTDRFIGIVWGVIGGHAGLFAMFMPSEYTLYIMTVMMSLGLGITAFALRINVLKVAALMGTILSYVMLWLDLSSEHQILLFGLTFALMFVLPGHYLQYKVKRSGSHG